jgi:hypothetical protein
VYERLLRLQATDGSLPAAAVAGSREVRGDVLAQALRVGVLLRAAERLQGEDHGRRLDALASALLRHVRTDGGVSFHADRGIANAWCAMFAHQALVLHSRAGDGASLTPETTGPLV